MGYEVGKNRLECVGDVEEGADLMAYYCDQIEQHNGFVEKMGSLGPGEDNVSVLRPYGVWAVISPFNFPLALASGPAGGALAAGNTVVFKPASDTPLLGAKLTEIVVEAGLPAGIFNFVTGPGSTVGQELIDNAGIDGIVFTGSKEVGLKLMRDNAARPVPRPLIIEMGGKNPAIVAGTADLDKATDGVMRSAFGAQGQKCSACSRVYIQKEVRDKFVQLLVEKTKRIKVGNPLERDMWMGPVINEAALKTYLSAVDRAKKDGGKILVGGRQITESAIRSRLFRRADDHRWTAAHARAIFGRTVRPDHGDRRRDLGRRGAGIGQPHGIRSDGRHLLGDRRRSEQVLRAHPGRGDLRQSTRRCDNRGVAGHQSVWRLEGQRLDRPGHGRALLRATIHARTEPSAGSRRLSSRVWKARPGLHRTSDVQLHRAGPDV